MTDFNKWWETTGREKWRQPRKWIAEAAFNAGRNTMQNNQSYEGTGSPVHESTVPYRIISTLHTGEVREGVGSNLGEAIHDLYRPKLQRLRAEPDPRAKGTSPIFLLGAIGRGKVRTITDQEYNGFQGAESDAFGGPLVIEWEPDDFKALMEDLGLEWPYEQTLTIVDAQGISINGWDETGYAYDVQFSLALTRAGQC